MTGTELKYFCFWAKMFQLAPADFANSIPENVMTGHYVEKYGDRYVFLFEDLQTSKKISAGTRVVSAVDLQDYYALAFDDIDYMLATPQEFRALPKEAEIAEVESMSDSVQTFLDSCSEDDRDTLDLSFEGERVLAWISKGKTLGIARSTRIPDTELADVTMLVQPEARGRGLSVKLMSELVRLNLEAGLLPKYRVAHHNLASIAVAKKLGFTARWRLQTWELSETVTN